MDVRTIRIIKASSLDREGFLPSRIKELEAAGFKILFDDITPNDHWNWTAGSVKDRSNALNNALLEPESDAVMWARGGYGASDLLDLIPWDTVAKAKPKPIIGFSDVCAAQSALYAKTGRLSIHGPMPATFTWKKSGTSDVDSLINLLQGKSSSGDLDVGPILGSPKSAEGILFGGCLSVLTSLIATPYLPKNLNGHILYFEDTGGTFSDLGGGLPDSSPVLLEEIYHRYGVPTFHSKDFGHVSPNLPIVMGAKGVIKNNKLKWTLPSANS